MKMKRGEKGFTLIELLIVIAIIGVLAAVVIPNVGRFIGSGEKEAAAAELANLQAAVQNMMLDNKLSSLPAANITANSTSTATANMWQFPQNASGGMALWRYGGSTTKNYTTTNTTKGTYYVDTVGTVYQVTTGY